LLLPLNFALLHFPPLFYALEIRQRFQKPEEEATDEKIQIQNSRQMTHGALSLCFLFTLPTSLILSFLICVDIRPVACVRRQRSQKPEEGATGLKTLKFKTPARLPSGATKSEKETWAVARFSEVLKYGKSSDIYDAYHSKKAKDDQKSSTKKQTNKK
jgi:hypothetical protein